MNPGPVVPPDVEGVVVLVRHGESRMIVEGRFQGQAETPLSELGERQAALAGARLAAPTEPPRLPIPPGPPVEIAHSPLARTRQTAEAIAAAVGSPVPLRPDPGLLEIGQGDWEGELHGDIVRRWGDVLAAWRQRPTEAWAPGGESLAQVAARVRPAIGRMADGLREAGAAGGSGDGGGASASATGEAPRPWSIVVGHDGVFKVLLLTLFDLPLARFWMWRFSLAGIAVVELGGGRAVLRTFDRTEHLAPLHDDEVAAEARAEARRRAGAL